MAEPNSGQRVGVPAPLVNFGGSTGFLVLGRFTGWQQEPRTAGFILGQNRLLSRGKESSHPPGKSSTTSTTSPK